MACQEEQQCKQVTPVLNGKPQSNQAQCKQLKLTCSLFCCWAWMTSSLSPSRCCRGSRSGSARRLGCIKRKSAGSSCQRKQQLQFVQCRTFDGLLTSRRVPSSQSCTLRGRECWMGQGNPGIINRKSYPKPFVFFCHFFATPSLLHISASAFSAKPVTWALFRLSWPDPENIGKLRLSELQYVAVNSYNRILSIPYTLRTRVPNSAPPCGKDGPWRRPVASGSWRGSWDAWSPHNYLTQKIRFIEIN